jgi:serine/threonine-protein kinase
MQFPAGSLDPQLQPGSLVADKYRVVRVLGNGGMGVVLEARHDVLGTQVAIKVPRPGILVYPEAVARFLREAHAAAKLKSDHVVKVQDVGTLPSGQPYIIMEYLEGLDLASWLASGGPLPITQAVDFALQGCVGLAAAHALGMVHRDVKPANLFCVPQGDGHYTLKLLDFGISKMPAAQHASTANATRAGSAMGSPPYMSPEQSLSSKDVDARTDIWALGVTLYQLLSGHLPFEAETLQGLGMRIATTPPDPLSKWHVTVPPALEEVVFRCLEKQASRRYETVADLALALLPFCSNGESVHRAVKRSVELVRNAGSKVAVSSVMSHVRPDQATAALEPRGVAPEHAALAAMGFFEPTHDSPFAASGQEPSRPSAPTPGAQTNTTPLSAGSVAVAEELAFGGLAPSAAPLASNSPRANGEAADGVEALSSGPLTSGASSAVPSRELTSEAVPSSNVPSNSSTGGFGQMPTSEAPKRRLGVTSVAGLSVVAALLGVLGWRSLANSPDSTTNTAATGSQSTTLPLPAEPTPTAAPPVAEVTVISPTPSNIGVSIPAPEAERQKDEATNGTVALRAAKQAQDVEDLKQRLAPLDRSRKPRPAESATPKSPTPGVTSKPAGGPKPAAAAPETALHCDPPYTVDSKGQRHYIKECFR